MEVFRTVEPGLEAELEEMMEELPVMALGLGRDVQLPHEALEQGRRDLVEIGSAEKGRTRRLEAPSPLRGVFAPGKLFNPFGSEEAPEHRNLVFHMARGVFGPDMAEVGREGFVQRHARRRRRGVRGLGGRRRNRGGRSGGRSRREGGGLRYGAAPERPADVLGEFRRLEARIEKGVFELDALPEQFGPGRVAGAQAFAHRFAGERMLKFDPPGAAAHEFGCHRFFPLQRRSQIR